jgi:hypothetical protein
LSVVINEDEELIIRKRGRQSGALIARDWKCIYAGKKTLCQTHLSMGINLAGSTESRRDERLERTSESRREGLRLAGARGCIMSSGLCTGEEIDLGVVRERWGRERARKGEEMAGWDEDELVGSLRMINGRETR